MLIVNKPTDLHFSAHRVYLYWLGAGAGEKNALDLAKLAFNDNQGYIALKAKLRLTGRTYKPSIFRQALNRSRKRK